MAMAMAIEIKRGQTHIKSKAMVSWATDEPLKLKEIAVQLPQAGEVLVRIVAIVFVTLTHSHYQMTTLKVTSLQFLVTKVCGIVEMIGEGVTS